MSIAHLGMSVAILEREGSEVIPALQIRVKHRQGSYLAKVTHLEWT